MKIYNMIQDKYNFSDFTVDHYSKLLLLAKKRYNFIFFNEINKQQSFILWRHDIDFSIHRAYRLAQIESELGIKSTYFIHLHNEYYNIFEKEISLLVKKIISLGHQIGLHFDTHYYNIENESELNSKLLFEAKLIKKLFDINVKVFSFHNTTQFTMSCQNWKYAGLINTYANFFQKNVEYCSDSNGYWRYNRLYDILSVSTSNQLQILTHPEWWQEEVMSPWERIKHCIDGRSFKNKKQYQDHLRKFNMKNIDWNGEIK
jgi:hypothetical protein